VKISKKALGLTKKFARGASCKTDFSNIEFTMFWPNYLRIAKELEKSEIDEQVVKKYWFEDHNKLVRGLLKVKKYTKEEAKNCMVVAKKTKQNLFCFHGGIKVCSIDKQEAKIIKKGAYKL
jgi:hypothetical protein